MHPIFRNIIAVMVGAMVAMAVNGGLIVLGGMIIPPPPGTDLSTPEGIEAAYHLLTAKHFIMPFLAHAFGTLFGALVAALIAANRKMTIALILGLFHLAGGIFAAVIIPAPTWFVLLDLIVAYIPMAYLAGKLVTRKS